MGGSSRYRQLRRDQPLAGGVRIGGRRPRDRDPVVLPDDGALASEHRRVFDALWVELDLGEHMVRGSVALLPVVDGSGYESEACG